MACTGIEWSRMADHEQTGMSRKVTYRLLGCATHPRDTVAYMIGEVMDYDHCVCGHECLDHALTDNWTQECTICKCTDYECA